MWETAKVRFALQRLRRRGSRTPTRILTDEDELTSAHGGSDPGRLPGGEGAEEQGGWALGRGPAQLEGGVTSIRPLGTCFVIR